MKIRSDIRHQIILPEQRAVYDYWRAKCREGYIPGRHDLEPSDVVQHLPRISLIENDAECGKFKYRLAGTEYWEIYDTEVTGLYVDDLPIGSVANYWNRVHSRVVEKAQASIGVTPVGLAHKSHLLTFWMRLPLSSDGANVSMILGYDVTMPLSWAGSKLPEFEQMRA